MAPPADVIAAVATAPGFGGIGIVRVSGADLTVVMDGILGRMPAPRQVALGPFLDADATPIDQGVALFFPAPHSYTGESVLELQGHGGPAVLALVLRRCLDLGARLAEPGEFTRRAFLNGKMDLAQAESVSDLIAASTASAARAATRSLSGVFSAEIHEVRDALIELRALIEASLDFPEEDIDFVRAADANARLVRLRDRLARLIAQSRHGALLREGLTVVLIGAPNVGKSSLLNRLAGDELAIVTPQPGTTRDPVRASVEVEGIPLHVVDTAGLRDTDDPVERIGVERTWRAVAEADLALILRDAREGAGSAVSAIERELSPTLPRIVVHNKIDLCGMPARAVTTGDRGEVWLSALRGDGIAGLRAAVLKIAGIERDAEATFLARERHVRALTQAAQCVETALGQLAAAAPPLELVAESLREAQQQLSAITGEFTSDDLLGEIFGRFCIGK